MQFKQRWYGPYDPNLYRFQYWQSRAEARSALFFFSLCVGGIVALVALLFSIFKRRKPARRPEQRDLFKNW